MTWRTARSILVLHAQLKAATRAAPPVTAAAEWGTIGDALHDPTSDHSPHDFPGWGDDIVTAGDFPNRPDLGLDAHKVLDDIRRSRDPRVKYGISNGQMFSSYATSSYPAWAWRPYGGSDGHFTHGHLSVVGDARADGDQPWATIGGDDMSVHSDAVIEAWRTGSPKAADGAEVEPVKWRIRDEQWQQSVTAALAADKVRDNALAAAVQALAVGSGIDGTALLAEIDRAITAAVAPLQQQLVAVQARAQKFAAALAAAGVALDAADDEVPAS